MSYTSSWCFLPFIKFYRTMLLIMGVLYCVLRIRCAHFDNSTNLEATILFYKDFKGKIIPATGPVPKIAVTAVRDDITSHINGASVKVVPVFQSADHMPKSVDILDYVRKEYDTVFIAETVPKRLTRSFIDNMFNFFLGKFGVGVHKKITPSVVRTTKKVKLHDRKNESDISSSKITTTTTSITTSVNSVNSISSRKGVRNAYESKTTSKSINKTKRVYVARNNKGHKTLRSSTGKPDKLKADKASSKDDFRTYVPNDIYYAIHKKCVNWADNCNTNNIMNMSSKYFKFTYNMPRIDNFYP